LKRHASILADRKPRPCSQRTLTSRRPRRRRSPRRGSRGPVGAAHAKLL